MLKKDYYFNLPDELIAQQPLKNRDESKLMVVDKNTGIIESKIFKDILDYLSPGDTLVLNNTRVIPARLFGEKKGTKGKIELLLLKRISTNMWETLVKPGRKAKIGTKIVFGNGLIIGEVIGIKEEGIREIRFEYDGVFEEILDELGVMPLPPYITRELKDKERYQTVYSKIQGSVAAPTAGLHFTNSLMQSLKDKGVNITYVTLHVGLGTFRPVKTEKIEEHIMHEEYYQLDKETIDIIKETKRRGKKVIGVGTTTIRTLESVAEKNNGNLVPGSGWTNIFIYPGFEFKIIDALITNFHLPESTLLMLISAFSTREIIMNAYEKAIKEKYRFFSFGDAMFIK